MGRFVRSAAYLRHHLLLLSAPEHARTARAQRTRLARAVMPVVFCINKGTVLLLLRSGGYSQLKCLMVPAAGDYKPGDVLGKYRVLEVIGRGSNGVTYKVRHRLATLC